MISENDVEMSKSLKKEFFEKFGKGAQTKMSKALHMDKSNLCRTLNGEFPMTARIYMTICNTLDSEDDPDFIFNNFENYVITNKQIGNVLRDLRYHAGTNGKKISCMTLASQLYECGIDICSETYIRRREQDICIIKYNDLLAYCKRFNLTIDDIYQMVINSLLC